MTRIRYALPALALLVAACSSGGAATTPAPSGSTTATRIEVKLTDALRIEPAQLTVRSGVPVTFVVTNSGGIDHEFYLGDEAAQQAHAAEMGSMGGMMHDEPNGIGVKPGETKELVFTFAEVSGTLAGCHVLSHYAAGMKAEIMVIQ